VVLRAAVEYNLLNNVRTELNISVNEIRFYSKNWEDPVTTRVSAENACSVSAYK
jgi:hypothetical protein